MIDLFPEMFSDRDLNLPESGDDVPDLLDEALWSLDLYRRLQTNDGAVSGGIEASAHPPPNSTSWTDDLAVYQYEPDIYATYIYAGVAAETAAVLERFDPDRAALFAESAERAMTWAEDRWGGVDDDLKAFVEPQRNVAAAAFLAITGDTRWHDVFVESASYITGFESESGSGRLEYRVAAASSCHAHTQCDAGWLYLQAPPEATDPVTTRGPGRNVHSVRPTPSSTPPTRPPTAGRWRIPTPP